MHTFKEEVSVQEGRKEEEDPGGSSMEGGSRGGESHLVGDIIRNVKYTAVKVHANI